MNNPVNPSGAPEEIRGTGQAPLVIFDRKPYGRSERCVECGGRTRSIHEAGQQPDYCAESIR